MRTRLVGLVFLVCLALCACGDDEVETPVPGDGDGDGDTNGDGDGDEGDGDASVSDGDASVGDGDAGDGDASAPVGMATPITCGDIVSDDDCDDSLEPIVFIHGTYGSGDNIANVALLFGSNGYCQDRFVAVDYNSVGGNPIEPLDALIDEVLERTGQDKVVLMGHSQGTMHAYTYLADDAHAAKVSHYVHIAGGARDAQPNEVPTLSLSSESDTLLGAAGVEGAEKSVVFEEQDHFAVASSTQSFVEIWTYLYGEAPAETEIQCGDEMVTLTGVARTFGDNAPVIGGHLDVFEVSDDPSRERGEPLFTLEGDENGASAPIELKRGVSYEFIGYDGDDALIGHQYLAPMKRSNLLVRFISPSKGALTALPTNNVVRDDNHVALIARSYQGAFRKDLGASFKVNGTEILQDAFANKMSATVGLFLFDSNKDGESNGGSLPSYTITPFVKGTDVFMSAAKPALMAVEYNGQTMLVPNWPSQSGGLTLVIFP